MRKRGTFSLLCLALIAFVAASPVAAQNTATVCRETQNVLTEIERELNGLAPLTWAKGDEAKYYLGQLNRAISNGFVVSSLDYIAYNLTLKAPTDPTERLAFQKTVRLALEQLLQKASGISSEDLSLQSSRLREQYDLRERRLADLNCKNLPAAVSSVAGSLQLVGPKLLGKDRKVSNGSIIYEYTETSAKLTIIGDPPDRREITWNFAGVPGSLTPGDKFTIIVTGELNFQPPGAEKGANNSAGVRTEGLTAVKEENAYFYQGASRVGIYTYQVPANAKKVVIALGADNNMGVFAVYCYGECPP